MGDPVPGGAVNMSTCVTAGCGRSLPVAGFYKNCCTACPKEGYYHTTHCQRRYLRVHPVVAPEFDFVNPCAGPDCPHCLRDRLGLQAKGVCDTLTPVVIEQTKGVTMTELETLKATLVNNRKVIEDLGVVADEAGATYMKMTDPSAKALTLTYLDAINARAYALGVDVEYLVGRIDKLANSVLRARIIGDDVTSRIGDYLPRGWTWTLSGDTFSGIAIVDIFGADNAGWTLKDYVLPRLASGNMHQLPVGAVLS